MLENFGTNIWLASGKALVAALGFDYPTRMSAIRLDSGELFIWSPVALTEELRASVDKLGPVKHLVAPNTLHHTYIGDWKRAYPEAQLHAAPGLIAKRQDLAFDTELGNVSPVQWARDLDQALLTGRLTNEVVFFHKASGTVLFADLIQQIAPDRYSGWRRLVAKLDLMTAPEPSVPRKFRLAFADRSATRRTVERILAWPIENLVIAHGKPVRDTGKAAVTRAFNWLKA